MRQDLATPDSETIRSIIAAERHREGPLLPILHALQAEYDHIPESALPLIAEALTLTRAEVHGVVTFYHDFREAPAGRHVVKVCRAEACQSMGANDMAARLLDLLGLDGYGTLPDGSVTVEPVYCLGLCACAPAAMVDGTLLGRADAPAIAAKITKAEAPA